MDLKDKHLLYELDLNSSQSYTKLGKKIRLSPQAIEQRIKKLKRKGIIKYFLTLIAYQKLGYTFYSIYTTFHNTTPEKETEIINKLKKNPNIIVIWKCEGKYDLFIGPLAKDVFELNQILNNITNQFGDYFGNYDIVTHIGAKHYDRSYLFNKKRKIIPNIITGGEEEQVKVDDIDKKILNYLIHNPRATFVGMTDKLGLSLDVIRYRYNKLQKNKVILGFSIIIDHEKIGNSHFRILFKLKNISEKILKEIYDFIGSLPNIKIATKCFGNYEFTLDIEVDNNKKLREIISKIRNRFSNIIYHYDILRIYSIEKFTTLIKQ